MVPRPRFGKANKFRAKLDAEMKEKMANAESTIQVRGGVAHVHILHIC